MANGAGVWRRILTRAVTAGLVCAVVFAAWTSATAPEARAERDPAPAPVLELPATIPAGHAEAAATPTSTATSEGYVLHLPKNAAHRGPLTVLVTVHGMGGDGEAFCRNLLARADANGWAVLSPTFHYRNYHDPALVREDDARVLPRLRGIIDALPRETGLTFRPTVLLYGFSRGAQVVHRFAQWYPERVEAVALFSAGSYTLPYTALAATNGAAHNMAFPYGVADIGTYSGRPFDAEAFRRVRFFVGVGGADTNGTETPRAWDATLGLSRVARAGSFADALLALRMEATFVVFPGVGHDVTAEMRGAAMGFLETSRTRA